MADPNMKVSVLVQLVDRLTAPLRGLTRGISATATAVGNLGRKIGIIGASLAALSFAAPIQQAAAWDTALRDIAITAGKSGGAVESMIKDLSDRYRKLAFDTGQSSADVAKGAQLLIASGMDSSLIDKLMPTIAKVATATGATIEDTAKTAFALSDSLKVPAERMEEMLGKLVVAGKLGRFEFKNMAMEFPSLTAQMAKFGITGAEAVETLGSALQIAMLGTSSPSEAANNLKNFLTKINAPEAIKKFEKELKVDVTGVMTDAAAKGINPVEAVIQKLSEKLKVPAAEIDKIMKKAGQANMTDKEREAHVRKQIGQLLSGTKVGKIYADMQVLDFLIPTLLNLDKLKEFKKELKSAGIDVIAQDFASRMRGLAPQMAQVSALWTAVAQRIGTAFASNIPMVKDSLVALLAWVNDIDKKWPGLVDGVLSWTGAILLLGAGIAILTPVFSALAAVLAVIFSPITILIALFAALAAGAYYVWKNWDEIGPKLSAVWDGIKQAGSDLWEGIKAKGDELVTWAQALPGRIVAALADLGGQLKNAGLEAMNALWEGMKAKVDELVEWAKGIPGRIAGAIGSIKLPGLGGPTPGTPGGSGVDPMGNPTGSITPGSAPGGIGGSNGFTRTAGGPAANSNTNVGGRIVVEAAEGSRIVNVQSENPAVPITPNRGSMLGRA